MAELVPFSRGTLDFSGGADAVYERCMAMLAQQLQREEDALTPYKPKIDVPDGRYQIDWASRTGK